MMPVWKLRREVLRLAEQLIGLPSSLASLPARLKEPARRAAYERDFDTLTQCDAGQVPFGNKPAIYLVYQPNGIVKSSLATLDWLVTHGYSPIVVSNSPIRREDRNDLLERTTLLLQRPNFGYDFGGYKDGIKLIIREGIAPERVIIMNDSVWIPMVPDLMGRLEQREDTDILGLLEDEKIIHDKDGGHISGRKHIESYFYMINAKAWQSDAFQKYWNDYEMTDSKPDTIKFGEIGFSRKMTKTDLKIGALTSRALFWEQLSKQGDPFIATSLQFASYADSDLRREGDKLRALSMDSADWRDKVLDHMRRCINRKRFNTTFCYANDQIFGTLFMKKNYENIFSEMRLNYIQAMKVGLVSPPHDVVLSEISDLVKKQYPGLLDDSQSLRGRD